MRVRGSISPFGAHDPALPGIGLAGEIGAQCYRRPVVGLPVVDIAVGQRQPQEGELLVGDREPHLGDIDRIDGRHGLSALHVLAHVHALLPQAAIEGRLDDGALEVELRLIQRRLGGGLRRPRFRKLRFSQHQRRRLAFGPGRPTPCGPRRPLALRWRPAAWPARPRPGRGPRPARTRADRSSAAPRPCQRSRPRSATGRPRERARRPRARSAISVRGATTPSAFTVSRTVAGLRGRSREPAGAGPREPSFPARAATRPSSSRPKPPPPITSSGNRIIKNIRRAFIVFLSS